MNIWTALTRFPLTALIAIIVIPIVEIKRRLFDA